MKTTTTIDRTKYIGGSDAAPILGISPWRTPLDVYLDKVQPRIEDSDPARLRVLTRGTRMEPYVIDLLAEEEGLLITGRNNRYIDPEYGFIACEIDSEYFDDQLDSIQNIEIKTVSPFKAKEWGEEKTDAIPVYYTAQAMHGLMVTGRQVCVFGVLIGADDFRVYRIERDNETISAMREREIDFWKRVTTLTPPEATTAADILRLFDKDSGKAIEATGNVLEVFNHLRDLKGQIKTLEAQAGTAEEQIKLFMQDASSLTIDGNPLLTWKTQKSNRFDQKSFGEAHPDLLEQFKKTSESRVFRIK